MVDRNVRAGDADRERAAETLRRHFAEGRLTPDEFDERLSAALTARTIGDLSDLLADLPPEPVGYTLPVPASSGSIPARRAAGDRRPAHWRQAAFGSWLTASLVCWTIWLIVLLSGGAGQNLYPWPIWVSGPWGAVILAGWLTGRDGGPGHGRSRR